MNGLRTNSWERIYRVAPYMVSLLLSLAVGYSVGVLGEFVYFFALIGGMVLFVLTIENRANVMYIYVALVPLSNSIYVQSNLFGIQGMKPFNVLGALVLALTLMKPDRQSEADRRADVVFNRYFSAVLRHIFRNRVAVPAQPAHAAPGPAGIVSGERTQSSDDPPGPPLALPGAHVVYRLQHSHRKGAGKDHLDRSVSP